MLFKERMKSVNGQEFLDEILKTIDFEAGGCFELGKLILLRNHARLVLHVPELLTIWIEKFRKVYCEVT